MLVTNPVVPGPDSSGLFSDKRSASYRFGPIDSSSASVLNIGFAIRFLFYRISKKGTSSFNSRFYDLKPRDSVWLTLPRLGTNPPVTIGTWATVPSPCPQCRCSSPATALTVGQARIKHARARRRFDISSCTPIVLLLRRKK